ncbi:Uncharacterised protein [Burkholderia pseudomallei]|nr:Uncharacterised protein [Burkholderia pseudomallei]CAJ4275143.1 Uncharacterised protein [Burkholderia pseudomallei]
MSMKDRIERLEEALAVHAGAAPRSLLIIYDPDNPPDFNAVMQARGLTFAVCLPDNGRCTRDLKEVIWGENPQTSGR